MTNIDPAWTALCDAGAFQGNDPPIALTPVGNLVASTTSQDPKQTSDPASPSPSLQIPPAKTTPATTLAVNPTPQSEVQSPVDPSSSTVIPEDPSATNPTIPSPTSVHIPDDPAVSSAQVSDDPGDSSTLFLAPPIILKTDSTEPFNQGAGPTSNALVPELSSSAPVINPTLPGDPKVESSNDSIQLPQQTTSIEFLITGTDSVGSLIISTSASVIIYQSAFDPNASPSSNDPQNDSGDEELQVSAVVVTSTNAAGAHFTSFGVVTAVNTQPAQSQSLDPAIVSGGSELVISGTTIYMPSSGSRSGDDGSTASLGAAPALMTIGSSTITANGAGDFVIAGQTLAPGGSNIVVSGTTLSLQAFGSGVVIDGATMALGTASKVVTVGPDTMSANGAGDLILAGETLVPGGTAITESGQTLSLEASATALIIASGGSTTTQGLASLIASGLGIFPTSTGSGSPSSTDIITASGVYPSATVIFTGGGQSQTAISVYGLGLTLGVGLVGFVLL